MHKMHCVIHEKLNKRISFYYDRNTKETNTAFLLHGGISVMSYIKYFNVLNKSVVANGSGKAT